MFNFNNKKTRRVVSSVIIIILVLAMSYRHCCIFCKDRSSL